jgi:hypothetical protein
MTTAYLFDNIPVRQLDNNGAPVPGALLHTWIAGTTTPLTTYTDATATTPLPNPIVADSQGFFPQVWGLGAAYDLSCKKADDTSVLWASYSVNPGGAFVAFLAFVVSLASSIGSSLVGFIASIFGAVQRTVQDKLRENVTSLDPGIAADGTDQTGALVTWLTGLGSFRGAVRIPYNTKFTVGTAYAAVPLGVLLRDESGVNTGQPPGYKRNLYGWYTKDSVSDDTTHHISSGHQPALLLNNFGTAGTVSAIGRYSSHLYGAGMRWNQDPIIGFQQLHAQAQAKNAWRQSWVINTSWLPATLSKQWVTATVVAAGAYCDTGAGNVYTTTAGGTTGATQPTHTVGTVSDGGVLWTYVSAWNLQSTVFFFDEDGQAGLAGTTSTRLTFTGGADQAFFDVDSAAHISKLRDVTKGVDIIASSVARGVYTTAVPSLFSSGSLSGATPTLTGPANVFTNGGSVTVTDMLLPAGQTNADVILQATNGNTTLQNNAAIVTLTGANVVMVSGRPYRFIKNSAVSSAWIQAS